MAEQAGGALRRSLGSCTGGVLMAVTAVPAFTAKGGIGQDTQTDECQDFTQIDCSITRANKHDNADGGPGRTDATFTTNVAAMGDPNAELANLSGTTSGGGRRCEFDNSLSGTGNNASTKTPVGKMPTARWGF